MNKNNIDNADNEQDIIIEKSNEWYNSEFATNLSFGISIGFIALCVFGGIAMVVYFGRGL